MTKKKKFFYEFNQFDQFEQFGHLNNIKETYSIPYFLLLLA